jgi:hypothetical protein
MSITAARGKKWRSGLSICVVGFEIIVFAATEREAR